MSAPAPRIGFLGPEGTFSHEALSSALAGRPAELVGLGSVHDVVMAVDRGTVERGLVPIENSLEGSVNATLDVLADEDVDVVIVGETVHAIRHCLISRGPLALEDIEEVVSHPQPLAQCARFLRARLPGARVLAAASSAEAVRALERGGGRAALGPRLAAELYGCEVLLAGVEDAPENETRFVWVARAGAATGGPGEGPARAGAPPDGSVGTPRAGAPPDGSVDTPRGGPPPGDSAGTPLAGVPWKTSLVFWGPGAEAPGWLVRCLAEFADRAVNLTRIESRPRRQGLGRYMFFLDLEGAAGEPHVGAAIDGLHGRAEHVRVFGSYPAA